MSSNERLLEAENNWVTALGAFFPGDRVVYRGENLFHDFNDESWLGLLAFGVTSRKFSSEQLFLLEKIWMLSISYPDPRLWNNRVATLAGTVRSTPALAASASMAVTEASIYGFRAMIKAFDFIARAKQKLDEGKNLAEIVKWEFKKNRGVGGFGRPLTNVDERIAPVMAMAHELDLGDGPHTRLAFDIEEFLSKGRWRFRMNIAGLTAALTADQDITAEEYSYLMVPSFLAGIIPCYVDSCNHPEGTFFPLRCDTLSYQGPEPHRTW
jgi:hypothetical protein